MPLEHPKEQPAPFTAAAVAADLERALGAVELPQSREAKERVGQGVLDNFPRCQEQLALYPQYPEEARRHLAAAALDTVPNPRLVLVNAEQWLRRAASPDELISHKDKAAAAVAEEQIVREAVKNFALLSASRRLNDMRQIGPMTISLLNRDTINGENQAILLETARQLLYAKAGNVGAVGSDVEKNNQAALADFHHDLLRRLLFEVKPEVLITPASQEDVAVEIDLDKVEIKEGIPPRLLEAECQLLATIAHMPNQEFEAFLRQQLEIYALPKAGEAENRRLTELLRVITRLKTLQATLLGHGEGGPSALMQHNEELKGLPAAAAAVLGQKIAGLSKLAQRYQSRQRPEASDKAA